MTEKINLVLMGTFSYPKGMAGTRRIQHAIDALKPYPGVTAQVILQRQSGELNARSGVHAGTPYQTVMVDLLRLRMLAALPVLWRRTNAALRRAFRPDQKNVIYFYGPLFLDSVAPLGYARRLGYRIVFDVIEDYGLAPQVSRSCYHYARGLLASWLSSRMGALAAGVIVISSHLAKRCAPLARGGVPVHYLPISVDLDCFPGKPTQSGAGVTLFYAGSFGKKDGLPVLLDAFDELAARHGTVRLVLTGQGDGESMREFFTRRERSPHRDRIDYRGYLEEQDYYTLLNSVDIPCMTRVDLGFAHAGFPFKLGEFLATGKPVIASRVSDVERFLVSGHNAMLVRAGSSAELCEAAEFLINNRELAAAMGERGRAVAREFFDYREQGEALFSFLVHL